MTYTIFSIRYQNNFTGFGDFAPWLEGGLCFHLHLFISGSECGSYLQLMRISWMELAHDQTVCCCHSTPIPFHNIRVWRTWEQAVFCPICPMFHFYLEYQPREILRSTKRNVIYTWSLSFLNGILQNAILRSVVHLAKNYPEKWAERRPDYNSVSLI